ncbi:glycosyltransferase [Rubrivirga sp. IMCC43871]|uniref:glycosyltransferase n=1 Tax=Rubrivirga sp. IMCC43871 TaxID=3391575 RepID=UPI0039902D5C
MIPTIFGALLLVFGVVYVIQLGSWARGFAREAARTDALAPLAEGALPTITVVVAARDEEDTIGPCVDSILATDYPAGKLEVIVVDDDSADATAAVVRQRMTARHALAAAGDELHPDEWDEAEGGGRLRLIHIPEDRRRDRAHKKAAIEKAVAHARGELILTTDADCIVAPGWPRALAAQFEGPEIAFVSGPVAYTVRPTDGLFVKLQAMDFFGVMACGAGAIGCGRPHLANGANVGYRRETFEALGGFSGIDHVTSGDDELLMQKIAYTTPLDIRFCADPGAIVTTEPVRTVKAFVHQRKRWASKSLNYRPSLQRMILTIGTFYFLITAAYLAVWVWPALVPVLLAGLGLKALGDLSVMAPAARRFGRMRLLWVYPLHLLLHSPHSLMVGILGPLGGFEWKGRELDQ